MTQGQRIRFVREFRHMTQKNWDWLAASLKHPQMYAYANTKVIRNHLRRMLLSLLLQL